MAHDGSQTKTSSGEYRSPRETLAPAQPVPQLLLVWTPEAARAGERLVLYGPPVAIGRNDPSLAFPGGGLDDSAMSRKHAVIEPAPSVIEPVPTVIEPLPPGNEALPNCRFSVRDVGSSNGTFVNGAQIPRATALCHGDILRVGSTLLAYLVEPLPSDRTEPAELAGISACASSLRDRVSKLAAARIAVLLQGETGTGKDVAARALHRLSGRKGPFVAVDCPNISESLWESELFGHEKGAFTGADCAGKGRIREADRGTLFLDEIGDLKLHMQAKLLRVLETGIVDPVGGRPVRVNVRFVAATNYDLAASVAQGKFRKDLFARLAHAVVTMAPLRERRCDVPLLCRRFLDELCHPESAIPVVDLERLIFHSWPLNVRELRSLVDLLLVGVHGPTPRLPLTSEALDRLGLYSKAAGNAPLHAAGTAPAQSAGRAEPASHPCCHVGPISRETLDQLMHLHRGNVSDVAAAIGKHRWHLYRLLERHGIDPEEYRK